MVKDDVVLAKYWIDKGADINSKNSQGITALMLAIYFKNYALLQYLIEQGAKI